MEFEKLKEIMLREVSGLKEEMITMEARYKEDLNMDSLDVIQVVMAVEEEFGIQVPDDAAEKLLTVGDAVEAIKKAAK